ncbi:hypothetical protein [Puniceicoccus vermicola]|uniref:Uncharacterized protein n=1 Tax=Puniceicoccus vermicola TaxID=388746 RepID=A0A7X1E5P1_9BACT|nr:hypothetical protein [Puniceicoccus vermicola]MBC2603349.1 hypothetical protein [Puniceicoccus vermicola]
MKNSILFLGSIAAVSLFSTLHAEANLLSNGGFSNARGKSVVSWTLPQSALKGHGEDASFFEYGVEESESGEKTLRLAVIKSVKFHFWWQQEVKALPATEYALTVRYRGEALGNDFDSGYGGEDVGLYFLDGDKKWLGYVRSKEEVILDGEWHELEFSATSPDDAAMIGVRLGVMGNRAMEFFFDDAVLNYAN